MAGQKKQMRLGELLIERGDINATQLQQAIDLQQKRRHAAETQNAPIEGAIALGEILVELGFIKRQQLRKTLKWQQKLRQTTFALAFLAPLLSPFSVQAAKFEDTSADSTSSQLDGTKKAQYLANVM